MNHFPLNPLTDYRLLSSPLLVARACPDNCGRGATEWCDATGKHHVAPCDECALRAALARPDYSHVSYRSWCGVDQLHVYRHDPASPSGCTLVESVRDTGSTRAILARYGKRAQAGGQQGVGACAAQMRSGG